jgi:2-polyprenyl-3-methyl-5-hydroxy-6-metoxy-1,4-benzoquinol methylase
MRLGEIIRWAGKPSLYAPGTAFMWDDLHIGQYLLKTHLDPNVDLASRKATSIQKTVDWLLSEYPESGQKILDLGCGPGLYASALASKGHHVTGFDISPVSIAYAKGDAAKKNLPIHYVQANYLEADLGEGLYDLIVMIYTDLGVLNPGQRDTLLGKVFKALKPGGVFIFDVLNDRDFRSKVSPASWDSQKEGFWRPTPYLALSNSHLYEEEKVILYQHIVMGEEDECSVYRFWTHFYSNEDIRGFLTPLGFKDMTFREDVLPSADQWNGNNVTFCRAVK